MRGRINRLRAVFSFFGARPRTRYERVLYRFVRRQLGCAPRCIDVYVQAMTHRSCLPMADTPRYMYINERLEHLGDAVLDLCVTETLFHSYPTAEEGLLTAMRSKVVNTAHLADLAHKIQLISFLRTRGNIHSASVIGDALEAFIGAVYLDQGYKKAKFFVQERLLAAHVSLDVLSKETFNYKGKIVEWAQRESKQLEFESTRIKNTSAKEKFKVTLLVDNKTLSYAQAGNKKEAQQLAAKTACAQLNLL